MNLIAKVALALFLILYCVIGLGAALPVWLVALAGGVAGVLTLFTLKS